jgi:hypothetical protein
MPTPKPVAVSILIIRPSKLVPTEQDDRRLQGNTSLATQNFVHCIALRDASHAEHVGHGNFTDVMIPCSRLPYATWRKFMITGYRSNFPLARNQSFDFTIAISRPRRQILCTLMSTHHQAGA